MTQPTLFLSAIFAGTAAGIYGYVGWLFNQRVVTSPDTRLAWRLFTIWWAGLAGSTLLNGLQNLCGALGLTSLPLFVTAMYINILIICVALWGLLYYLIYLFTGDKRWFEPLTLFYIVYYTLLVYYVTASDPNGVELDRWSATLKYNAPLMGPFFVVIVALLLVPQVIGGLAYFTLYFHVTDATQKYRVLLVSWSIIVWFASPVLALAGGSAQQDWWQLASRVIGLASALTILIAYAPPRWLRQRLGVAALGEER